MARPKIPTALRIIRGMAPNNPKRAKEPKVAFSLPNPPKHLTKQEQEAWALFAEDVGDMRITGKSDRAAFRLLVSTYVDAEYLRAQVNKLEGEFTYECETEKGGLMIRGRPELKLLDNADRKLMVLLGRFGLTPSDRAGVVDIEGNKGRGVSKSDGDDEFT